MRYVKFVSIEISRNVIFLYGHADDVFAAISCDRILLHFDSGGNIQTFPKYGFG